jgi:hypothetical protein
MQNHDSCAQQQFDAIKHMLRITTAASLLETGVSVMACGIP